MCPRWPRPASRAPRSTPGKADRKSTRLNSSHLGISYAVFCLKKKKHEQRCFHRDLTSSRIPASHAACVQDLGRTESHEGSSDAVAMRLQEHVGRLARTMPDSQ